MKLSKVQFTQTVKLGKRMDAVAFTAEEDVIDIDVDFSTGVVAIMDIPAKETAFVPWAQVRQATQLPEKQAPVLQKRGPGRPPKEDPTNG